MHTLIIRHLGSEGDRHRCQVWRPDGKVAVEKKPTDTSLLKSLMQKLLGFSQKNN